MNIQAKLTLRFTVIVASILVLFSAVTYMFSASYRKEEFYDRLESRAVTTARLLVTVEEVDKDLLRIIERNSVPGLPLEEIVVFNKDNELDYSSVDVNEIKYPPELLQKIRQAKNIRLASGDFEQVGILYGEANKNEIVVIATAYDRYGRNKLRNLGTVLISGLIVGIGIIVLAGRLFARQALVPLAKMNEQVSKITAGSLEQRIDEGNKTDEIARLAMNFNKMLRRLETAFEMQKNFVSNASHELRTPLAVMRSQLQVALEKDRTTEEYHQVLSSLLEDTNSFTELTNGLLTLAQSGIDGQKLHFNSIRLDEVLFSSQEELAKQKPHYHFQFDYDNLPEDEESLTIQGNEQLLNTAFTNFMDNACKFSEEKTVYISLASKGKHIEISFRDKGAGIPPDELRKIFSPFYRAANAQHLVKGHGIGLSLCKRIIELHSGTISVNSKLKKGSTFKVVIPINTKNAL
ncbi:MAG: HAMP domain-containing protein [Lewinellaceae bacterium]|nr:HAMP domain-containing protein [Saprospiraceae bacterium]MCB9337476.1 HAMP domain-containing protein [Lewinellaceae bacterium]